MPDWRIRQGKAPQDDGPQEYQTIPIDKIGDFGMHVKQYAAVARPRPPTEQAPGAAARLTAPGPQAGGVRALRCRYYPLEISYFKSSTDSALLSLLWNKYWVNTLSTNALLSVWTRACARAGEAWPQPHPGDPRS